MDLGSFWTVAIEPLREAVQRLPHRDEVLDEVIAAAGARAEWGDVEEDALP